MVEQVASLCVGVYGHVLFRPRDGTASCNSPDEGPKLLRVQGVAKGEEVWEESDLLLGEVVEGGKVPGLVDLYVRCVQISSSRREIGHQRSIKRKKCEGECEARRWVHS